MKILPMGFDDEQFGGISTQELYSGVPYPGTRAVVWASVSDRDAGVCTLNLYFDPPIPGSCGSQGVSFARNRCIRGQEPIEIEYSPLALQANIFHLVELYRATLPTEVTTNEAT